MIENWVENAFIFYCRNWFADGTFERRLVIFGYYFADSPRIEERIHQTGFRLSLYDLTVMTGDKPPETWEEEFKLLKNYPLFKLFLGKHVTCEEPDEDSEFNTTIDGKRYTITRHQRWTSYAYWRRWFKIKGSWTRVYSITSPEDPDLPPYTFAHKSWIDRIPSPEEVLRQAKVVQELTADLGRDLEGLGYTQSNPDDKEAP